MTDDADLIPPQAGPNKDDLQALKDGAAMLTQAGNRVAAMSLLWSAVALDPIDLGAHRRLAATLAHGGDIDGAADEYARYIEFLLPLGEVGRAAQELSYGASTLGGRPALRDAAEKIVVAVRGIVDNAGVINAAPAPQQLPVAPPEEPQSLFAAGVDAVVLPTVDAEPEPMRVAPQWITPTAAEVIETAPSTPVAAAPAVPAAVAPVASRPVPARTTPAPMALSLSTDTVRFRTPRLLAKVPFRFCVHTDSDRHWMQLEGGTKDLVPVAVRVVDRHENIIETRLCLPLTPGDQGHARVVGETAPAVAWVVVGIPDAVVAAIDESTLSPYLLQAKVGDEWLSLDMVDTGCRLGRTRALTAAS